MRIKNLHHCYENGTVAIKNLNLEIYQNQIFALLGHNGAGKTTLISIISGLLKSTSGKVNILGKDIINDHREIRKIIGFCS